MIVERLAAYGRDRDPGLALGAARAQVLRLALRESMTLVATGTAIGLVLALSSGLSIGALLTALRRTTRSRLPRPPP